MIIKCPNCDAALEYDPITNGMKCNFCNSHFLVEDFSNGIFIGKKSFQPGGPVPENNFYNDYSAAEEQVSERMTRIERSLTPEEELAPEEMIEYSIYKCTTCGAEVVVNGLETSTFCMYCGQPTIIFDRVTKTLKPDYVVPFMVSKEQAVNLILKKMKSTAFISKDLYKMDFRRIRGIYIPYWVVDTKYHATQKWWGTVGSGEEIEHVYFEREAETEFKNLTIDASKILNDNISQKLEPYNLTAKKPFEIGYLSGFYSERYDLGRKVVWNMARNRTMEIFDEEVKKTIDGARDLEVIANNAQFELKKAEYVLLPAWFLTFRYEGVAYTLLVNGQTGKIVGGIPWSTKKLITAIILITIVSLVIFALLFYLIPFLSPYSYFLLLPAIPMYATAFFNFRKVYKSSMLTKEADLNNFSRERQEGV